jgi:hypothetical protein
MTRIKQIILALTSYQDGLTIESVEKMMQEYAEYYAERFRQKLLENAWKDAYGGTYIIDEELKKIKLPDHE